MEGGSYDKDWRRCGECAWASHIVSDNVIAGGAIATFVGLATAGSVLFGAINAEAKAPGSQIVAVVPSGPANVSGPATLEIVPSPVIDQIRPSFSAPATGARATTPRGRSMNGKQFGAQAATNPLSDHPANRKPKRA